MYEWGKEQTAKSITVSILQMCFLKHKIAVDSAARGEKLIFKTQWEDILKMSVLSWIFFSSLLLEIIWLLRNTGMGNKVQWVTFICAQKTFIVKDFLEHILLPSTGYNQNFPIVIYGLWHK